MPYVDAAILLTPVLLRMITGWLCLENAAFGNELEPIFPSLLSSLFGKASSMRKLLLSKVCQVLLQFRCFPRLQNIFHQIVSFLSTKITFLSSARCFFQISRLSNCLWCFSVKKKHFAFVNPRHLLFWLRQVLIKASQENV